MKKVVLLFFILIGTLAQGKCHNCDTIDMYWIYYNDTIWVKLNQNMYGYQLKLDKSKISKNDSISIEYGTDTPCPDCWNSIQIKDNKDNILEENKGKGPWAKISFSVSELFELSQWKQIKSLYFYYNNNNRKLLLQLKFE